MLGMSGTELVIILALALLLLGPDQLPSLAKSLGKGMRELRKATDDLKSTFEQEMASVDLDQPRIAPPPKPLVVTPLLDPGEARAAARMAASGQTSPASGQPAVDAEQTSVAAGQTSPAAEAPALKLVAPEGTVVRGAAAAPALDEPKS